MVEILVGAYGFESIFYRKSATGTFCTKDRLTDLRIRQNREFFNVAPQIALDIFKDIAQTIDDAVVTEYEDNKPKVSLT